MNQGKKYTSLKLSKELQERADKAGVVLPKAENKWVCRKGRNNMGEKDDYYILEAGRCYKFDKEKRSWFAYDILNEICCEHAKLFFGKKDINIMLRSISNKPDEFEYFPELFAIQDKHTYQKHTKIILQLLQQNKKEEAENYILDNLKF